VAWPVPELAAGAEAGGLSDADDRLPDVAEAPDEELADFAAAGDALAAAAEPAAPGMA
jgi:hypothetical protein